MGAIANNPVSGSTCFFPAAAVPALAGMAAAVCLRRRRRPTRRRPRGRSPPRHADPHGVDAASYAGLSRPSCSPRCSRPAGTRSAQLASYTVRSGDSLSSIAGKVYHKQNAWPVLYYANRAKVHWANVISAGQVLKVPALRAKIPAAPGQTGPAPAPAAGPGGRARASVRVRARPGRGLGQLLGRQRLVRRLRDRPGVRRQLAGHERERALRPVPVQRVDLAGVRRFGRRLRARQRVRAEPGVQQRDGAGRPVQLVPLRRLLTG